MKILILYGYFPNGHYSVSTSLYEEFSCRSLPAKVETLWHIDNENLQKFFAFSQYALENQISSYPSVFGQDQTLKALCCMLPKKRILEITSDYDVLISTHPYTSYILADFFKSDNSKLIIDVHTNFSEFPVFTHERIDFHTGFIMKREIDANIIKKIALTGIPINKKYSTLTKSTDLKNNILIMNGSDGLGGISDTIAFLQQIYHSYKINVSCGRNVNLLYYIQQNHPSINAFSYTSAMEEFYIKSKFVFTKASGSSVIEAISCGCIPVFTPTYLPWEIEAARNLSSMGIGLYLPEYNNLQLQRLKILLDSESLQKSILQIQFETIKTDAASRIAEIVVRKKITPPSFNHHDLAQRFVSDLDISETSAITNILVDGIKKWGGLNF